MGKQRIREELTRLRDAVAYIHDRTVAGMNAGKDVYTLMREITLPSELEVGEGYGTVQWNVRAIWENYAGWLRITARRQSCILLHLTIFRWDLLELAGADAIVGRARKALGQGDPVRAISLAEIVATSSRTTKGPSGGC